jgi:hypothetical protein
MKPTTVTTVTIPPALHAAHVAYVAAALATACPSNRPPCDCGAPAEACRWHGDTRREYACDACYRATQRRAR